MAERSTTITEEPEDKTATQADEATRANGAENQKAPSDAPTAPSDRAHVYAARGGRRAAARPRVVILGGGFGGLSAARTLGQADLDIVVIDRTNHHLFQPLLYQVATAALAPSDITAPIRHLVHQQKNTTVVFGEIKRVDADARVVYVDADEKAFPYDYLIMALGTRHSYFGHDEWEKHAPGLKTLGDALEIRQRFLMAFELAEKEKNEAEQRALLTFVLVGGGPTGCELAGVIPEIARKSLREDFRIIDTAKTRVILIEAGPRILPAFEEKLADKARQELEGLGVEVRTGAMVVNIDPSGVTLKSGEHIEARTVIWAAGNAASPIAKGLGASLDKAGRVQVESDLSVKERPEVFVVGDLATVAGKGGKPVPGVAQGAIQGGKRAALNVLARVQGKPTVPFSYFDKGNLAVIGRNKAIADIMGVKLSGFIAWAIWLFIHVLFLVGFRNRLSVLIQWANAYVTYARGARIISAGGEQRDLGQTATAPGQQGLGAQTQAANAGPWS